MAKKYYLPRGEYNKLTWLNNFAVILPKYKDTFNLTDEEMDTVYQYQNSCRSRKLTYSGFVN